MSHTKAVVADHRRERSADFDYSPACDAGGVPLAVSVFGDDPVRVDELVDDVLLAGMVLRDHGSLQSLLSGDARPLGEVVLVDCSAADAIVRAALSRLDMRAAHAAVQLVVSTSASALEDVFACCDQSRPQILVDASPAERLVALGRVMAQGAGLRLRELSEEERSLILRLSEQVSKIAARIDAAEAANGGVFQFNGSQAATTDEGGTVSSPPLPDPRLVRKMIRQRQLRARFFDGDLFADPPWDMLLDLTAARAEHNRVSVTSLCIASGVPPTTALRWIGQMVDAGLLQRSEDDSDRRRAFIALTDRAAGAMARYFAEAARGGLVLA